jgi:dipeptidyl aminopeptidase/acylaminoacyl peptidase
MDTEGLQPHTGLHEILEKSVIKATKHGSPELYHLASPIRHINTMAPPFMLIQGDKDTLVALSETRFFAEKLRHVSRQPVVYIELPGAQHAFDLFPSLRTELTLHGVEKFVSWVLSNYPGGH